MIPFPAEPATTPVALVSILKKKRSSVLAEDAGLLKELEQRHEEEFCLRDKAASFTPDSGTRLLPQEEEEEPPSVRPASPCVSGPTPITEPTDLEDGGRTQAA